MTVEGYLQSCTVATLLLCLEEQRKRALVVGVVLGGVGSLGASVDGPGCPMVELEPHKSLGMTNHSGQILASAAGK